MKETLLNLFFPPKCPFCRRILREASHCPHCAKTLPWNEEPLRRGSGYGVCAVPLRYEGAVREAILRYKFQGCCAGVPLFARLMTQCVAEELSGAFDCITWVPVSRKRRRRRGFDQSELLAQAMAQYWGTTAQAMLEKYVDNPPQSSLKEASTRRGNVLGVYRPKPEAEIAGKRILLVDDIVTTGATLTACAEELRLAGADAVVCCALATATV